MFSIRKLVDFVKNAGQLLLGGFIRRFVVLKKKVDKFFARTIVIVSTRLAIFGKKECYFEEEVKSETPRMVKQLPLAMFVNSLGIVIGTIIFCEVSLQNYNFVLLNIYFKLLNVK